ncbi:DUF3857 domain-containing protein [Aquimarina sp. RZ0]|nr:DUF3857 domain-containing protein [Aquimarina sp. RZ0]
MGIFFANIFAQTKPVYEKYDWEKESVADIDVTDFQTKDIVAFKDKRIHEFCFLDKEGKLIEYALEHKILWLNSNDRIEEYNKVYLPYSASSEIVRNKARVITKDGKVIELDQSKVLTAKDDETQRTYKYYALEGVEKGSFIEYFYVVKKYPSYTGHRVTLQTDYDKKNVEFDLYAPTNLIFQTKTYNGLPEIIKDTLIKDRNHWQLYLDTLSGVQQEEQAPYNAMTKFLIYKLKKNLANPAKELVSYSIASQNIYNVIYPEIDKKTHAKVKKFIESIPDIKDKDLVKSIRTIENFVKSNMFVTDVSREDLSTIATILDNKVANEQGVIKLYAAIFNELDIKHQIVLTSNRDVLKFDKNFEAFNFLQEYLIYFPKLKLYMSPSKRESRVGFPPGNLTDNYGLFIKKVSLGGFTSGVGSVKYIKPVNYDKTRYDLVMNVSFDTDDMTTTNLTMDRAMSGYYAIYIQPFMDVIKKDDKDEMLDGIIKSISENVEITNKKVYNDNPEAFGSKPLRIVADLVSDAFVEKAGRKYLFKVGELIGPQQEMYQEKERKLPVENEFERSYSRKIIIEIPKGYQVLNPDDINITKSYSKDDEELFMFNSSYELKGNQLTISITERYNQNIINIDMYEAYRSIINSAANFNKVTLVLDQVK